MAAINVTLLSSDSFSLANGARQIVRNSAGIPYVVAQNDTDNTICVYKAGYILTDIHDEYGIENADTSIAIGGAENYKGIAQSFTGDGQTLYGASFYGYVNTTPAPSGTVYIRLYAATGASDDQVPTGSILAEGSLDVSEYPINQNVWFSIPFSSSYTTTNGQLYAAVIWYNSTGRLNIYSDNSSGTHAGNLSAYYDPGAYWAHVWADREAIFRIHDGLASEPAWFIEQDSGGTNKPSATDIAAVSATIDGNDYIHIAYMDPGQGKSTPLNYIRFRADGVNDDWFEAAATVVADIGETPTAGQVFTAIAVDSNNVPHTVFIEYPKIGGTSTYVLAYKNKVGGSWNATVYIEYTAGVHCQYMSILFGIDNVPIVAYERSTYPHAALGNANNATSFTTQQIFVNYWRTPHAAIDSDGNIWYGAIRYQTTLGLQKHALGAAWSSWTSHDLARTTVGGSPQVAPIGSDIYVFYEDNANDIVYDIYDGSSSWAGPTTLDAGSYNTLKLNWSTFWNIDSAGELASGITDLFHSSATDAEALNAGLIIATGQSFTGDGRKVESVIFRLWRNGTPTGTAYAKLWAATGTYGSTSVPTGTVLATSTGITASTVPTTTGGTLIKFDFPTPYQTTEGTKYFIAIEHTGNASNYLVAYYDAAGSHGGNKADYNQVGWAANSSEDLFFTVLSEQAPTDLAYIFLDESATVDILFNTLPLSTVQNYTMPAAYAGFSLSGQAVSLERGFELVPTYITFSLAGQVVLLPKGKKMQADYGAFSLAGQDVDLARVFHIDSEYVTFSLAGQDVSLERGFVLTQEHVTFSLAGQDVSLERGLALIQEHGTFDLTGQSVTFKRGFTLLQEHGTFSLAGQDAGLFKGKSIIQEHGTFDLTGQSVTFKRGYALIQEHGTFSLAGQDVTLTYNPTEAYSLTVEHVTFSFNGQDVSLERGFNLSAVYTQFVIAGYDVVLRNLRLQTEHGTFNLAGQNVALNTDYNLVVSHGTFNLAGQDAGLRYFKLTAEHGTFTLAGQDVNFATETALIAEHGTFILSGQTVSLISDKIIAIEYSPFSLSGQSITFVLNHNHIIERGSFTLNTQDANLYLGYALAQVHGIFSLSGQTTALISSRRMGAQYVLFSITGEDVLFKNSFALATGYGVFSLSGQDSLLKLGYSSLASHGNFTLAGQAVAFRILRIQAEHGTLIVSGQDVSFAFQNTINADAGLFTLSGQVIAINADRFVSAGYASFSYTGQSANLLLGYALAAANSTFLLSGEEVLFVKISKLSAAYASFTLAGQNVTLTQVIPNKLIAETGIFLLSPQVVNLHIGYALSVNSGQYTFSTQVIHLYYNRLIKAVKRNYYLAGHNPKLRVARKLPVEYQSYTLIGYNVILGIGHASFLAEPMILSLVMGGVRLSTGEYLQCLYTVVDDSQRKNQIILWPKKKHGDLLQIIIDWSLYAENDPIIESTWSYDNGVSPMNFVLDDDGIYTSIYVGCGEDRITYSAINSIVTESGYEDSREVKYSVNSRVVDKMCSG